MRGEAGGRGGRVCMYVFDVVYLFFLDVLALISAYVFGFLLHFVALIILYSSRLFPPRYNSQNACSVFFFVRGIISNFVGAVRSPTCNYLSGIFDAYRRIGCPILVF